MISYLQMFRFGRQIHNLTAEKKLLKKKERRGKLIVTEMEIKQQKTPKHCRGHKLLLKYRHNVRVMKIKQAETLEKRNISRTDKIFTIKSNCSS